MGDEKKMKLVDARVAQIFARLQEIFDLRIKVTRENCQAFLTKAKQVSKIREEYVAAVTESESLKMEILEDYEPTFARVKAFDDLTDEIFLTHTNLLEQIERSKRVPPTPPSAPLVGVDGAITPGKIKMEPLEIPKFDGSMENWTPFHQLFKKLVHENRAYTDLQRVTYLVGHLTGSAKSVVIGIPPTEENYSTLYNTLVTRFEDKRALGSHFLDKIMNFKALSQESEKNLNTFLEQFVESSYAMKNLGIGDLFDFVLVHLAGKKLDAETWRQFDMANRTVDLPTFDTLVGFVRSQAKILARNKGKQSFTHSAKPAPDSGPQKGTHSFVAQDATPPPLSGDSGPEGDGGSARSANRSSRPLEDLCPFCKVSPHRLYECAAFRKLPVKKRFEFVKGSRICFNCLSSSYHVSQKCKSTGTCRHCGRRHHQMLHFEQQISNGEGSQSTGGPQTVSAPAGDPTARGVTTTTAMSSVSSKTMVLLSTAQVSVVSSSSGQPVVLRALLDPGSMSHFIRKSACEKLGVQTQSTSSLVKCLGAGTASVSEQTTVTIRALRQPEITFTINLLVLEEITDRLPSVPIRLEDLPHISTLALADPNFHEPGPVDLLLGASLWPYIIGGNRIEGPENSPVALESSLGWLLMGNVPVTQVVVDSNTYHTCIEHPGDFSLERFWALEEIPESPVLTPEDAECERFFLKTVTRNEEGRFVVALPFRLPSSLLGNSRESAKKRFFALERRLLRTPGLHQQYCDVMRNQIVQGYMSEMSTQDSNGLSVKYYIPHHGVLKAGNSSTPLRVVLDASAVSDTNYSLNDLLYAGPKLQSDIFAVLLNFRLFETVIGADIRQMFLRILMRSEDRPFQLLLWRESPQEELREFCMNTVVFGVRSSPYLAQRCIHLLIEQDGHLYPAAARVATRDFYVDNLLSSFSSVAEAGIAQAELSRLFAGGSLTLTKWCSNSVAVLEQVPQNDRSEECLEFDESVSLNILGVRWNPKEDTFSVQTNSPATTCTKRLMQSAIARIFDPLGLLAPLTIVAKTFIRELWLQKLDWDDTPPEEICSRWQEFVGELRCLAEWNIPRHSCVVPGHRTTLAGFADASQTAYGAVVYVRSTSPEGETKLNLLCAKSRVAPAQTVSIPRLELCAVVLLAKLLRFVLETYKDRHRFDEVLAFSDSTIALQWISSPPSRWRVFVANRVTKVQRDAESARWLHVRGECNPADCLSRGLSARALMTHVMWFQGPDWLHNDSSKWPCTPASDIAASPHPAEEKLVFFTVCNQPPEEWPLAALLERVSTHKKLIRSTAHVLRFLRVSTVRTGELQASEIEQAENLWIKYIQNKHFAHILEELHSGKPGRRRAPKRKNPMIGKLALFVKDGIIRVGGRLQNSNLEYDHRHPILLPKHENYVELLVDQYHRDNLHTGPHILLSLLHLRFWILSARSLVRRRVHACNLCFRSRPTAIEPQMAPLPLERFQQLKAFATCGVDYAGPFNISMVRTRGNSKLKAYVCVFTCLSTRAVHFELASSLSTDCFLAAFRRFLSRRGPCSTMWSDQGTNFVGARNVLNELYRLTLSHKFDGAIQTELANRGIEWRLNPPASPHFGGVWEIQVKALKTHLYKIIGPQLMTYEEFNTAIVQIEALLNSRPLGILSTDPSGPTTLTPAHFLSLGPTLSHLPAADLSSMPVNRLDHYQLVDQVVQSYWKRWKEEYLYTLQGRQKWTKDAEPIFEGTVVVLVKENTPPLHWPLAVVEEVFMGSDGVTRVARIKTKDGTLVRPLVKLCPLPSQ